MLDAASRGDARATGKLISAVEAGGEAERAVAAAAFPRTGQARVVGVTGPPGAGKSSLVDSLVTLLRGRDQRVAIVAVDPSSPFTGGAILGDRLRMQDHATDHGVYVRSMATRGQAGGLARATIGAVRVLDAAGWPWIVVETVGAGQVEIDVAQASDTTMVVVNPGWGDAVQAVKAGLLEVADVFVVNKADRPGADQAVRDLELTLDLALEPPPWRPPVVCTTATTGDGVEALWDAVVRHQAFLAENGRLEHRRTARLAAEIRSLLEAAAVTAARQQAAGPAFDALVA
ncbi:MAG: methylmalonyl Co-A mutase-associated GTPase MeaB, partial [Acidimicrobiales bacterium]